MKNVVSDYWKQYCADGSPDVQCAWLPCGNLTDYVYSSMILTRALNPHNDSRDF